MDESDILPPPGVTEDIIEEGDYDITNKTYPIVLESVIKKYTDPLKVAEVVCYLEEKVLEHGAAIAEIKSTLYDIRKQMNKVEVALEAIQPIVKKIPSEQKENLTIVLRAEWGAQPTSKPINPMKIPIRKVNFTFSTKTESCHDLEECGKILKQIQKRDMRNGLPDIGHNFLIGEDGRVYEGRGWYLEPAVSEDIPEGTTSTIDIAYIGDYTSDSYPFELMGKGIDIMNYGVEQKIVAEKYKLL